MYLFAMKKLTIIHLIAICILFLSLTCCSSGLEHNADVTPLPAETAAGTETAAENVTFRDKNGKDIELYKFIGDKPIILKFIDCSEQTAPDELKLISDCYPEHSEHIHFFVVLQKLDPGDPIPETLFEESSPLYPLYYDPDGSASGKYGADSSATFFIDRDGFISVSSLHPITREEFNFALKLI